MTFRHIILTKFNLRTHQNTKGDANLRREWSDHRFGVFEKFCYPSVLQQSCQEFDWLVFFDPDTDPDYVNRLSAYPRMIPVFEENIAQHTLRRVLQVHLNKAPEFLITSRLDNDDAIHRHFVRNVQQLFREQTFAFLNFRLGCQYHDNNTYSYVHEKNPFISLIEKYDPNSARTVWCCKHNEINAFGQVQQVATEEPMWMMVIHERNASNWATRRKEMKVDIERQFGVHERIS